MKPTKRSNYAEKKTRDLPNLTECHSCGFRVDTCTSSGKQKLQPLYSEWRIVLLCNKCYSQVESFKICSYCFKESTSSRDDSFNCSQCKRLVHKSCFAKHSTDAPWSYSLPTGSAYPICIDCWVPKCIASKREVKVRKNKVKECSRVLTDKYMEDVVKDASCVAKEKAEVAIRARDLAVRKALAARRAADLALNALDLIAEFDSIGDGGGGNGKECNADDNGGGEKVDDAILAFRLHRAINSSPRILKSFSDDRSLHFVRRRLMNGTAKNLAGGICLSDAGYGEPENCGCKIVPYPLVYRRTKRNAKGRNLDVQLEGEGSCSNKVMNSNGNDNSVNPVSPCSVVGDESVAVEDEKSDRNDDHRYLRKYSRRKLNGRSIPASVALFLYDNPHLERQG